jgi:hypothetical protein
MLGAIEAGLELGTEILKLVNTQNARKYRDRIIELKMNIHEEEEKGPLAIDSKIEAYYQELTILLEAIKNEMLPALKSPTA